ncbi:extracellular solute-binding protein [Arthrobacter sp. Z1-9]
MVYNTFLDPASASDPRAAAQTKAIKAFQDANPNIEIKVNVDPGGANVPRAIAAKTGTPDVFRVQNLSTLQFVKQGGLAPLDEYLDRDGIDRNDWLLPQSFNQVAGETYLMQQDYRIPVFLYRADAYKEAGISAPPATFEDVLRNAGNAGGKMTFPIGFGASGGFFAGQAFLEFLGGPMLVQASGGKLFAENGLEPAFSESAVADCAEVVKEMIARNASNTSALNWGFTETHQALQTGSAISANFGLYRYSSLKAAGAQDLAWAPPPASSANGTQTIYGQALAINSKSENKDAAWEFVKHMTSAETQAALAQGGEVVARKSAYEDPYFATPEAANLVEWKDLVVQRGAPVSYSLQQPKFGEIVSSAMTRMILENKAPAAAANEIMSQYADAIRS